MKHDRTCIFCGDKFNSSHLNAIYCGEGCVYQIKQLKAWGVPLGSREHAIQAREWRIKQHHESVNTADHPQKKCIPCLANLGMGCKRIGRRLGISHCSVAGWLKRYGLAEGTEGRRRVSVRLRTELIDPNVVIMEGYEREAKALVKFDETRHWGNHPKVGLYAQCKRYKIDPEFRKRNLATRLKNKRANIHHTRGYMAKWKADKRRADPAWRIKEGISTRLSALMRGRSGSWSKIEYYLGCTTDQLKAHLQAQFRRHMGWNNYGKVWHVDHIVPLSRFDHSKDEQIKTCWNWQNLRPMWARANIRKNAKLTKPQMHLALTLR